MLPVPFVLSILLSALATEATVKVLLSGKVFDSPREWLFSRIPEERFLGKLIRCPYCLSFWFAFLFLSGSLLMPKAWLLYCSWMAIQRLSNVFDDLIDRVFYGQYGGKGLDFGDKGTP